MSDGEDAPAKSATGSSSPRSSAGTGTRQAGSNVAGGFAGRGPSLVRRAASFLPPAREDALVTMAQAGRSLLTGRALPARQLLPVDRARTHDIVRAREALNRGDDATADAMVERILAEHPNDIAALNVLRVVQLRQGRVTAALATLARTRELGDTQELAAQERRLQGRMIETEPRWRLRVAGPSRRADPRGTNVVMHLQRDSVPYLQNGHTMRGRYTVLAQRQAGLEPFVVTSLNFPRCLGVPDVQAVEEIDGIRYHRLDLGPGYPCDSPADVVLRDQAWLTARVARREGPAIIHANSGNRGYELALVALAVGRHVGLPVVYEVRSFLEATWASDAELAVTAELYERRFATEVKAMRAASAVITIADAMRDEVVERGIPADRVHVVPNGVDPTAFSPRQRDPELIRRYALSDRTVIGYVSTLDHPREGHEVLIEATCRLLRAGRRVTCLIVGDGRRRAELEALSRRLGADSAVIFTGAIPHDRVADYYALLDAFVVPRRDDRAARFVTPLKPFEAMAVGVPLVVADLPALMELAGRGERGLAFPVGDAEALATTIERLIDEPELGRRLAEAARRWVVSERTWASNGQRYRTIYESVIQETARSTSN